MILLLVVAAWMLTVSLVAGLCVAARAGDTQLARRPTPAGRGRVAHGSAPAARGRVASALWQPDGRLNIGARANKRSARPEAAVALHSRRGVAA
jgi:hypothetical protein